MLSVVSQSITSYYNYNSSLSTHTDCIQSLSSEECLQRLRDITKANWKNYTVDIDGSVISRNSKIFQAVKNTFSCFFPLEKSATNRLWEASHSIQQMMDTVEADAKIDMTDIQKNKLFDRVRGIFEKLLSYEIKSIRDKASASLWKVQQERSMRRAALPALQQDKQTTSLTVHEAPSFLVPEVVGDQREVSLEVYKEKIVDVFPIQQDEQQTPMTISESSSSSISDIVSDIGGVVLDVDEEKIVDVSSKKSLLDEQLFHKKDHLLTKRASTKKVTTPAKKKKKTPSKDTPVVNVSSKTRSGRVISTHKVTRSGRLY